MSDNINDDEYIDNTESKYVSKQICIKLNSDSSSEYYLRKNEEVLCKKFPLIKNMESDDRLKDIIDNVFKDGFIKRTFVRNLSFTNNKGRDKLIFAIRPEILSGDYLSSILTEGYSLLFKGYIKGTEFIIDGIDDTSDTEQLPFEVVCEFIPKKNPQDVLGGNFFIDVFKNTESLTKYTEKRLAEWEEYLKWKETFCKRQIVGVKYYRCDIDVSKRRLNFWLVCRDKEYFENIKKYLKREMKVFENNYSSNNWEFKLSESNNRNVRYKSIELGRFCGVLEQYELNREDYAFEKEEYENNEENSFDANFDNTSNMIVETELFKYFEHPYIVKVAYDLNRADKEEMDMIDFDSVEEIEKYLYENILTQYFSDGFIALSAVGEFQLMTRFHDAIDSLTNKTENKHKNKFISYSPNLAVWLFNISQARLPNTNAEIQIESWLNSDIAGNENQRIAVEKMLLAPDVCLIQGPPGTGKTTVIAEGIYQFVKKGYRVLVASQSNDAVDNALERLADSPVIRAVRLGQLSRKKRGIDVGAVQYSIDTALQHYYNAISKHISTQWLSKWNKADSMLIDCDFDNREVVSYNDEIVRLSKQYNQIDSELQELRRQEQYLTSKLDKINSENAKIRNEKSQLSIFIDFVHDKTDISFYLSDRQLRIVESIINPIIVSARKNDVFLTLSELSSIQGENNECEYIRIFLNRLNLLGELLEKINKNSSRNIQEQNTIELLQIKAQEIKNQMADAYLQGDMDSVSKYREQFNQVKYEIDVMKESGNLFVINSYEKDILSDSLYNKLVSNFNEDVYNILQSIYDEGKNAIEELCTRLSEFIDSLQLNDLTELTEKLKAIRGQYDIKKGEINSLSASIVLKQGTLSRLAKKYGVENVTYESIINAIKEKKNHYEEWLNEKQFVRQEWESTMQKFCNRLNNTDFLDYDNYYFQKDFIKSCNVVGISCTASMKELSDYNLDYFDVVIIDEVSKATPPELLIPLMRARKAVIVGDHRQLPPMFKEHERSYNEMFDDIESVPEELLDLMTKENFRRFKKMVTSSLFKEYFEKADESIKHSLLTQYRMHSDIMDVINRFYEMRLKNGLSNEVENISKAHGMKIEGVDHSEFILPQNHAYWIDSSLLPSGKPLYDSRGNKKTANSGGTSVYNIFEKWIIIELLKMLADGWRENFNVNQKKKTVGIISFYQAQVNLIREEFRKERKKFDFSPLDIDINTVDRFQGKEKNIVITSLVRNNPKGRASQHIVAFERINVAFSRAQEMLIIVGAKKMYEKQEVILPNMDKEGTVTSAVYRNIIDELSRKGTFKDSKKVISSKVEKIIIKEYEGGGED